MEITTLMLLFILIWGIIGIAFFCIGIGLHARGQRKRSVCTRPVTAIVVDLQRERVGVDDFSVSGEAVMKSWFPVYEYMIDGVKQKVRARVGTAKPEVNVGQAVELFVNPDRTDEFYCPTEKISCIQKVVYRSWSSMSLPCGNYGSDPLLLYIMPESGKWRSQGGKDDYCF